MTVALISLADKAHDTVGECAETALRSLDLVTARETIQPDLVRLKGVITAALADPRFEAVVVLGELNMAGREAVVAMVQGMLERRLNGFAQIARGLLMEREGSKALFSWSCAGAVGRRLVVALPCPTEELELLAWKLLVPRWNEMREWARA